MQRSEVYLQLCGSTGLEHRVVVEGLQHQVAVSLGDAGLGDSQVIRHDEWVEPILHSILYM